MSWTFQRGSLGFSVQFLGNPFIVMSWVVQLYLVTTSSCYVEVIQIFLEACPTLGLLSLLFSVMDCECRGSFRGIYPSFPFAIWGFLFLSFWGSFSPNCRMASSFGDLGVRSNSAYFILILILSSHCGFVFPSTSYALSRTWRGLVFQASLFRFLWLLSSRCADAFLLDRLILLGPEARVEYWIKTFVRWWKPLFLAA